MHIYQLPISLYSFKLRLALKLKGLDIELREPPGGSYRTPEYHAINPAGTIPAVIDGDLMLTETDSIIEYLEDRGEGTALFPINIKQRARMRMLSRWVDLRLEAAIRSLFGQVAPVGRNPGAIASADKRITDALALIEGAMDEAGPFMLGAKSSMADCGLVASLCWLDALATPLALTSTPGARMTRTQRAMAADPRVAPEIAAYCPLLEAWVAGRIAPAS
ncbi:MAG: glutathione S-transferase family protein [Bosea sp. (in: a-proteobacteria)]